MAVVRIKGAPAVEPPAAWAPQVRVVTSGPEVQDPPASGGPPAPLAGPPKQVPDYTRTPFVLTCVRWLNLKPSKYLSLTYNPSSVQISLKRRGSSQKTYGGSIRHASPRRRFHTSGNMDEFDLTMQFQSGNIVPVYQGGNAGVMLNNDELSRGDGSSNQIPGGLNAVHMLADLLNEDVITPDGKPNYHYVFGSTLAFPSIVFLGFFKEDGPSFEMTAQEPNSMTYSVTMECYSSYPRFSNGTEMTRVYRESSRGIRR